MTPTVKMDELFSPIGLASQVLSESSSSGTETEVLTYAMYVSTSLITPIALNCVDQASKPLPQKRLSILEGLTLKLIPYTVPYLNW